MTIRYRNTPLQEAVFEFAPRATLNSQDQFELIGELRRDYSGQHQHLVGGFAVQFETSGATPPTLQPNPMMRERLWTEDRRRTVLFGPDLSAFNAMAPYTHFVDYLPFMERFFLAYARRVRANSVAFLGQRYINRITLPQDADPVEYFTVYPRVPADWPHARHRPFTLQILTEQIEHGQVVLGIVFQQTDPPSYLVDIYARTRDNPTIAFEWESVRDWQSIAHEAVKRAFEFAITDRCRTLLGREDE